MLAVNTSAAQRAGRMKSHLKLMNDVGIRANGVKLGVRRCLVTIRVRKLHSSL